MFFLLKIIKNIINYNKNWIFFIFYILFKSKNVYYIKYIIFKYNYTIFIFEISFKIIKNNFQI